jgi:hypothetical protein
VRSYRAKRFLVHAREARERIACVRSQRVKRFLVHAREAREARERISNMCSKRLLVHAREARKMITKGNFALLSDTLNASACRYRSFPYFRSELHY